jgi:hypothetical protein
LPAGFFPRVVDPPPIARIVRHTHGNFAAMRVADATSLANLGRVSICS